MSVRTKSSADRVNQGWPLFWYKYQYSLTDQLDRSGLWPANHEMRSNMGYFLRRVPQIDEDTFLVCLCNHFTINLMFSGDNYNDTLNVSVADGRATTIVVGSLHTEPLLRRRNQTFTAITLLFLHQILHCDHAAESSL